jgi:hypothetical protein
MEITDKDLKLWEEDQKFCEIADEMLKILTKKGINIGDSLRILEKAKKAVERSIQSANWGVPLICEASPNEACTWLPPTKITEEVKRRNANA